MAEFREQDFSGARFERVNLRGATFTRVAFNDAREAWTILERLWDGTLTRTRTLPEAMLHENVDGEWSFIQTLRHLSFATAAWVNRMVLGYAANGSPRSGTL